MKCDEYGQYENLVYPIAGFDVSKITLMVNGGAVWVDYPCAISMLEAKGFNVNINPQDTQMMDAVLPMLRKRLLREERKLAATLKKIDTLKKYEKKVFVF